MPTGVGPCRPEPVTLPDVLSDYRCALGLSARAAGVLTGASVWAWAKWESGTVPSPVYLRRLAELLELPLTEMRLLAGPDRVRRPASAGDERSHPLARARLRAELSAAQFARQLHISPSLVSKWEAGTKVPTWQTFPVIARVLGIDISEVSALFGHKHAPGHPVPVPSLRTVRERRNLSQARLAVLVGVHPNTVRRWERESRVPGRRIPVLLAALRTELPALARPAVARTQRAPVVTPLRRLREQRQLSLRLLAARAHVSPLSLEAWERGTSRPDWAQARALARALKCPVADVFTATGLKRPSHLDASAWTAAQLPAILAELRRWNGWTQQDLALMAGVTAGTVRAWEQGRHRPRPAALKRLDERLRAPVRLSRLPS